MRSSRLAAGLACALVCASACRPTRQDADPSGGDPRPAVSPIASRHRTPEAPSVAATAEDDESPFAPMIRGSWREAKGSRTYAVTVDGSRFVAVEFQKDREIGRYEGRLRGRQVDATYVSDAKGPLDGRASLELSNDGSHLFGAFTLKEQFTPLEWVRNATE